MTAEPSLRDLLSESFAGSVLDRMTRYAELLEEWSPHHNLVRFSSRRELVDRHLLDAHAGARLLVGKGRLVDVGSGAGLPGIPLLIAQPDWEGVLLEPRQKRWAFLKRVIRELDLSAEAVDKRYQELPTTETFRLVTARALGGHEDLLEWARGRLSRGGGVALWTTDDGERRMSLLGGWRVLSWPFVGLDRGRLVYLQPEGHCST
jgi:16S rRNA (guanine527-N7)-methyltransferase